MCVSEAVELSMSGAIHDASDLRVRLAAAQLAASGHDAVIAGLQVERDTAVRAVAQALEALRRADDRAAMARGLQRRLGLRCEPHRRLRQLD